MSKITLPKRYHPDFRLPNRKPVGPVEIDWDNRRTWGLKYFIHFTPSGPVDLVTGQRGTCFGGTKWTPDGQYFDGVDGRVVFADITIDDYFSLQIDPRFEDLSGSVLQYFMDWREDVADPFTLTSYRSEASGASPDFMTVAGVQNSAYGASVSDQERLTAVQYILPGQAHKGAVRNAVVTTKFQFGSTVPMVTGTHDLILGGRVDLDADRFFKGTISHVVIFSGPNRLHEAFDPHPDLQAVYKDPWQLLRPAAMPSYSLRIPKALPLPKQYHPDFHNPLKKPLGPVQLDPQYAHLLHECFLFENQNKRPWDYAHKRSTPFKQFNQDFGRFNGQLAAFTTIGNKALEPAQDDLIPLYCLLLHINLEAGVTSTDASLQIVQSFIDSADGGDTNVADAVLRLTGGSGVRFIKGPLTKGEHVIAIWWDGSEYQFAMDGKQLTAYDNAVSGGPTSPIANFVPILKGGSFSNDEWRFISCITFNRPIPDSFAINLTVDPYQLLEPTRPPVYYALVIPGFSIINIDLDDDVVDGQTGVIIALSGTVSATGKKVFIEQGGTTVEQTVTAEDLSSVTITVAFGSMTAGAATLYVRNPLK